MAEKEQFGPIIERDEKKTKKHSKRVIFFFIFLVGAIIVLVGSQAQRKKNEDIAAEQAKSYSAPKDDFANLIMSMQRPKKAAPAPELPAAQPPVTPKTQVIVVKPNAPKKKYYSNQFDQQAAGAMREINLQALTKPPKVEDFTPAEKVEQKEEIPKQAGADPRLTAADVAAALMQDQDPNKQAKKRTFLKEGAGFTSQGYSEFIPEAQKFYLELKAGTIIPGILLTGINSDLPGQIIGQVSENVWDTARGKHVLIPKGTKVLGVYDSQITFGQKRVLVLWNRLVFPNGTTLNIAGSPGMDSAGFSGLKGKVDEHWGKLISVTLLASLFVTGAEVINSGSEQRTGDGKDEKKSPGDIASEQAANAILSMASKLFDKISGIQPTIHIRPGCRFNIFVQKDIVFPEPYF